MVDATKVARDASPNALPVGTRIDEFEIAGLVGEGGFGIVYRAFDHSLHRDVALKEYLPASLASRGDDLQVSVRSERYGETFVAGLKSFINEARLLASFDHPSLLKVYRFWEAHGTAYMVMPLLHGTTLKQRLQALGAPPDEHWLRALLGPLTEALAVLHAAQCYHRDIAPDNIMLLEGSERALLMDFGAARRVIGDMTQALTVILKPGYAPVEQYADMPGMTQGPWTDLYALAAVVHRAITGRTPPPSVARLLNDTYVPLKEAAAGRYSDRFLGAIDHALAVRFQDRPASVEQLLREMGDAPGPDEVLRAPPVAATAPDATSTPEPVSPATMLLKAAPRPTPQPDAGPDADERTQMFFGGGRPPGPGDPGRGSGPGPGDDGGAQVHVVQSPDATAEGRVVPLREGRLEIGREAIGDLCLADPACSRRHAAIERTAEGYRVVDLGSANGTFVNHRRLAPGESAPLLFGARVMVGATTLGFRHGAEEPDHSGRVLAGRYRLRERLRAGPKSAVYRATTDGSELPVAVKLLARHASAMADHRRQFEDEAAIAKRLRHPNICALLDYGLGRFDAEPSGAERPFLVYTLLEGGSLEARLHALGEIPAERLRRWIGDAAGALQHAHAHLVVHGNLKPSAICFDEGDHVYLTDFAVGEAAGGALLMGTPAYMAPELWAGERPGVLSDQFAFAAVAYQLLTGALPFVGQDDAVNRERNFRRGAEPAHAEAERRGRPPLPTATSPVLARALHADAQRRFASVGDFAAALQAAFAGRHVGGRAPAVFISYQRAPSGGWAMLIENTLREKHGIRCFVDSQRFDGAVRFPDKLADAVRGCEVFVCLLAASTLRSRWVREEIRIAYEAGRPMVPVFQESFKRHAALPDDPAVRTLMEYDGVELLDRRNVHVQHTIGDLVKQIRLTLEAKP